MKWITKLINWFRTKPATIVFDFDNNSLSKQIKLRKTQWYTVSADFKFVGTDMIIDDARVMEIKNGGR